MVELAGKGQCALRQPQLPLGSNSASGLEISTSQ